MRLAALFLAFLWLSPRDRVELLETGGVFHGDEVKARSGERWLALYPGSWETRTVTISMAVDEIVDGPGEKTGKRVRVNGPAPLLLLRGMDQLAGTKVRTWWNQREPLPVPVRPLKLGTATLHVTDRLTDRETGPAARLVLTSSGRSQTLYEWPVGLTDQACALRWAGDADGDGRVDLLLDVSGHNNVAESTLYLSSRAPAGSLVKRVAAFVKSGC